MRVALIGCGRHANEIIGPALRTLGAVPDIVADSVTERANDFALKFAPLAIVCSTWIEALEQVPTRAVVAVSPEVHAAVALECIARGIPVLVEKPPSPTAATSQRIAEAALASGTGAFVGFNFRLAPAVTVTRDLIRNMSPIAGATVRFFSRNPMRLEYGATDDLDCWLRGNGIHAIDLIYHLFGMPDAASARCKLGKDGNLFLTVTFSYESGTSVVLLGGNVTPRFELTVEARDETGRVVLCAGLTKVKYTLGGRRSPPREREYVSIEPLASQGGESYIVRGFIGEYGAFLSDSDAWAPLATMVDASRALAVCELIAEHSGDQSTFKLAVRI